MNLDPTGSPRHEQTVAVASSFSIAQDSVQPLENQRQPIGSNQSKFVIMGAPGGVEPPTNGLGNRCSIHLSYGAIGFKHTTYKQLSMSKTAVLKLIARIGIARFSKRKPTIITRSEAVWLRFYRDGGKRHQSEGHRIPLAEKQRVPYSRRRFGRCH